MEVMGLMLGQFVDEYTVNCVDVFAMPQSGTGASVEAVDPVFQTKMLEMLKQTGRPEMVVGWYHSHPGFGCWMSGVDINTQQSFEALNPRAVAVVIDPIQSVKGKVVIDCFRLINPQSMMLGQEPRQTTSNVGHLKKPSIQVASSLSISLLLCTTLASFHSLLLPLPSPLACANFPVHALPSSLTRSASCLTGSLSRCHTRSHSRR